MIIQIWRKELNKRYREKEVLRRYYWKEDTVEIINTLYEDRKMVLNTFESGIFPLPPTDGTGNQGMSAGIARDSDRLSLKLLTPKEMIQRLPIALAQVKSFNKS